MQARRDGQKEGLWPKYSISSFSFPLCLSVTFKTCFAEGKWSWCCQRGKKKGSCACYDRCCPAVFILSLSSTFWTTIVLPVDQLVVSCIFLLCVCARMCVRGVRGGNASTHGSHVVPSSVLTLFSSLSLSVDFIANSFLFLILDCNMGCCASLSLFFFPLSSSSFFFFGNGWRFLARSFVISCSGSRVKSKRKRHQ